MAKKNADVCFVLIVSHALISSDIAVVGLPLAGQLIAVLSAKVAVLSDVVELSAGVKDGRPAAVRLYEVRFSACVS